MRKLFSALLMLSVQPVLAAEGMWTLDNLPAEQLEERYGFTPDAAWTERAMRASVRLAGGCSGSFVSAEGLVLTNSHCIIDCVAELSSEQEDLVNDGFVAADRAAERRCDGVELNRLEQITDVTGRMASATSGRTGKAFVEARNATKAAIESECAAGDTRTRCDVVELYQGARSHLYRYHRFQDVRLVFAPEYASGFFGGDPDNFNFPRYNLDMGLLRAYEDGQPARVEHYFAMPGSGVEPGDATFVLGHPGSTQRQLTVSQLQFIRDLHGLNQLLDLAERRGLLLQYSAAGGESARIARDTLTSVENSYKVWNGRLRALADPALMEAQRQKEQGLIDAASAEQRKAWEEVAKAQERHAELWMAHQMLERSGAFWSEHFRIARHLVRASEERPKPNASRLREYQDANLTRLSQLLFSAAPIYPDYEQAKLAWSLSKLRERIGVDDPVTRLVLGKESPEALAQRMVQASRLADVAERKRLWEGGSAAIAASDDPFIRLARATDGAARAIRAEYENEVEAVEKKAAEVMAAVRFARDGTRIYPDATFTLRLSDGEVRGWEERGQLVPPFTDFAGLYARATGFEPFKLAPRWLEARERVDLSTPFNLVTTNDIIGGNSGSPMLNRQGEIVGLVFDGNIHSLGGAYGYDERLNRTVAVDARAILEALDQVYGAEDLVKELGAGSDQALGQGQTAALGRAAMRSR